MPESGIKNKKKNQNLSLIPFRFVFCLFQETINHKSSFSVFMEVLLEQIEIFLL
jgi:hypothetical protein